MNKQMKSLFTVALIIASGCCNIQAQYYYKDILSVQQATAEKNSWQQRKIRNVMVHSFEADKTPSEGFYCEKKISKDYRTVETYTKAPSVPKALAISYYDKSGLLVKASDSSEVSAATSLYEYGDNNNITRITSYSHSSDEDFVTALKEVHEYRYNAQGKPERMLRIRNERDTLEVLFSVDAKGNVTDEVEKDVHGRHFYYYYDANNRLTDIVKYNVVKKAPKPDFIFEYDSDGLLEKMTTVEEGLAGNYYTWRYVYNDGLKIIEKCYERNKTLVGYIEYEYGFE